MTPGSLDEGVPLQPSASSREVPLVPLGRFLFSESHGTCSPTGLALKQGRSVFLDESRVGCTTLIAQYEGLHVGNNLFFDSLGRHSAFQQDPCVFLGA